ncbi:MAG: hypothetical protein ACERKD_24385 [Prolixibacteraceae bacterium]
MFLSKYIYQCIIVALLLHPFTKTDINSSTILQINNFCITSYEYEKELNKISEDSTFKRKIFRKEYIENAYLIAHAYKLGWGENEDIIKRVNSFSDLMMVQKNGYLWQKTTSPIIEDYIAITASKLEKRSKMFYYDYVRCNNIDSLPIVQLDACKEITLNEYMNLKGTISQYDFLINDMASMQWPFGALFDFKDILYREDIGLIPQPVIRNNIVYYFYLDSIGECQVSESDKRVMQQELKTFKESEIDRKKTLEMDNLGEIFLYDDNINLLADFILSNKGWDQFHTNVDLVKYRINHTEKIVNYKEFCSYERNLPFRPYLKTKSKLVEEIKQYYYDDYLKNEAIQLGLYNSKQFLLDKQNYKNKLVLNQYLKSEIEPKIKIDSLEIVEYYNSNLNKLKIPKATVADLYYFTDRSSADIAINEISKSDGLKHDSNIFATLKGLVKVENDVILNNANLPLSKEVYNLLEEQANFTTLKQVIQQNQNFIVVIKKETQLNVVPKLDNNLYQKINAKLHQEKFQELRTSLLNELMKKYTIKTNKIPEIS